MSRVLRTGPIHTAFWAGADATLFQVEESFRNPVVGMVLPDHNWSGVWLTLSCNWWSFLRGGVTCLGLCCLLVVGLMQSLVLCSLSSLLERKLVLYFMQ